MPAVASIRRDAASASGVMIRRSRLPSMWRRGAAKGQSGGTTGRGVLAESFRCQSDADRTRRWGYLFASAPELLLALGLGFLRGHRKKTREIIKGRDVEPFVQMPEHLPRELVKRRIFPASMLGGWPLL